jgi:hypothetical protein
MEGIRKDEKVLAKGPAGGLQSPPSKPVLSVPEEILLLFPGRKLCGRISPLERRWLLFPPSLPEVGLSAWRLEPMLSSNRLIALLKRCPVPARTFPRDLAEWPGPRYKVHLMPMSRLRAESAWSPHVWFW